MKLEHQIRVFRVALKTTFALLAALVLAALILSLMLPSDAEAGTARVKGAPRGYSDPPPAGHDIFGVQDTVYSAAALDTIRAPEDYRITGFWIVNNGPTIDTVTVRFHVNCDSASVYEGMIISNFVEGAGVGAPRTVYPFPFVVDKVVVSSTVTGGAWLYWWVASRSDGHGCTGVTWPCGPGWR